MSRQTFSPYLFRRKFKLITDHRPLKWVFSNKDPSSRVASWDLKLEEYYYEILYKPSKINKNADPLSRIKLNHFNQSVSFQLQTKLETN